VFWVAPITKRGPQGLAATGSLIGRKCDSDGNPVGKRHTNPILDTHIYEVQFPDGHVEEFAVNVIVENLYSQVDDEGKQFLLLDETVKHRKDANAVTLDDM